MRSSLVWIAGSSLAAMFFACSSSQSGLGGGTGGLQSDDGGESSSGGGLSSGGTSGGSGGFSVQESDARSTGTMVADSACKAGFYQGTFAGIYSSHITVIGVGIPVTGNIELTLDQQGSSDSMCTIQIEGEGLTTESCNNVFTVSGGSISGVADKLFPYYCSLTGTLDCAKKELVNGWIECTYCALGVIPDGGGVTSGDPLAVCEGAGGNFAGVLEADYDTSTLSFTGGVWNGAEDLCTGIGGTSLAACNDGGSPGPEGGPPTNYLRDAGYGLAPNYGGSGSWNASCLSCEHD
jgi:hypothetical protein